MNIGDVVRRNAYRYPRALALSANDEQEHTWSALNARVNMLANALFSLGFQKSDRVAILSGPRAEVVELYFACAKLGLVIVPIHTGLVESEIEFILKDVEARGLFVEAELASRIESSLRSISSLEFTIAFGPSSELTSFSELASNGDTREPPAVVDGRDLYAIRFTSGTTGTPKGCPSTHYDWLRRSMNFLAHIHHSHDDRALLLSPLSLGVGSSMLMSYSLVGAQLFVRPRFDAADILRIIEQERITTFMIPVPTLFGRLLDSLDEQSRSLESLRVVGYGGAVFPLPLLRRTLKIFKCDFFGVYGHLEAGGFSTYLMPSDHKFSQDDAVTDQLHSKRLSSCGREAIQADVRVVDEAGAVLPSGQVGELVVRTEGMISDYWNRPGEISNSIRGGWFHTGDAASIDEDGYVYISDRLKDVVRTGGMNVSSLEVEGALIEIPGILEAAIIGVPDPRWGESVMAIIVETAPGTLTEAEVIQQCRGRLATYKVPKRVAFVASLPKNSMGKVLKRELKQQYHGAQSSSGEAR